jgi:hypothetical protein
MYKSVQLQYMFLSFLRTDLAPAPTQQPMLSGASIWGEGEKAWRSQTLLHHPDPEPSAIYVLKNSKFTKKVCNSSHKLIVYL